MNRLLRKPAHSGPREAPGKFEKFCLVENPFPSEPVVNQDSTDRRINGDIYEIEIRRKEYDQIERNFLSQSQADPNHLRLGFIIDTSYIGRGNGKSAFLINLQNDINAQYALDVSNGENKCFAAYITPEPGGRTKTFPAFVDLIFESILRSGVVLNSLAILLVQAINEVYPGVALDNDEDELIRNLFTTEWYTDNQIELGRILDKIYANEFLQDLPSDFPLFVGRRALLRDLVTDSHFKRYYEELKKGKERLEFVFTHLIRLFQAAGFNGAYLLVDDFERIPTFQSARQKKDFALELRSCLFDGLYLNARLGFYNLFLVLHAGVPRMLAEAWQESGMENRCPIQPAVESRHIIPFEKLSKDHASLLIQTYLGAYRPSNRHCEPLFPFTMPAIGVIGESSEYNAAKILKTSYDLLEQAACEDGRVEIDEKFVADNRERHEGTTDKAIKTIEAAPATDLRKKAEE